jgi:hypothetical protein
MAGGTISFDDDGSWTAVKADDVATPIFTIDRSLPTVEWAMIGRFTHLQQIGILNRFSMLINSIHF